MWVFAKDVYLFLIEEKKVRKVKWEEAVPQGSVRLLVIIKR